VVRPGLPAFAGSAPPARGAPAPLPGIQDDWRATWPAGPPGRVPSALSVAAPHRHGALVTQPRVVSPPRATLGTTALGYSRRLPSGLSAPAVRSTLLGCHSSPPPLLPPNSQPQELSSSLSTVKQQRCPFQPRSLPAGGCGLGRSPPGPTLIFPGLFGTSVPLGHQRAMDPPRKATRCQGTLDPGPMGTRRPPWRETSGPEDLRLIDRASTRSSLNSPQAASVRSSLARSATCSSGASRFQRDCPHQASNESYVPHRPAPPYS
jgi:hypothetical protein